ncbi:unnamed protein product [Linum tenue]|uniref:Uncharacterized protein n=1 Tax=Linum tenue TaxID=586396 RepID=A0AAV0RYC2_9ROSI|nr:unnamed protein product [Linum tenue]CAI0625719.1 unnamed protein product [Linum tenue]
MRAALMQRP